jgi:hypothetical protein
MPGNRVRLAFVVEAAFGSAKPVGSISTNVRRTSGDAGNTPTPVSGV